jgi:hypothetical protein
MKEYSTLYKYHVAYPASLSSQSLRFVAKIAW